MAIDVPCEMECGRWATPKTTRCEVCNGNRSVHKSHKPAQRMRYRQRLALANRRQESYAEEFGDPKKVDPIEMEHPIQPKAKVIRIGPHLKRRAAARRKRA